MLKQTAAPKSSGTRLTFSLPADHPVKNVSVVGSFNEWKPGANPLRRRSNGTVSVSVTVPAGTTVQFRYLGENGQWFDEPDADQITPEGSLVRV